MNNKVGRPETEWSNEEFRKFEALCSIQCTQAEICAVMNITDKTLNKILKEHYAMNFSECFKRYSASGRASLRRDQFNLSKTNAGMAIWLGKQYLGQKDSVEIDSPKEIAVANNLFAAINYSAEMLKKQDDEL